MNLKNMMQRLTSNYNKNKDGNIYKFFFLFSEEIEILKNLFEKIESWRGIKNAKGKTLDLIGEDLMQERQGLSDENYKAMLKFKASLNKSATDINSVNTALKNITDDKFIRIYEGYRHPDINEPASIFVEIKEYSPDIKYEMINSILAAGVRVYLRAISKTQNTLNISSVAVYGETTTIYPYSLDLIKQEVKVYIASGYNTSYETVKILPK